MIFQILLMKYSTPAKYWTVTLYLTPTSHLQFVSLTHIALVTDILSNIWKHIFYFLTGLLPEIYSRNNESDHINFGIFFLNYSNCSLCVRKSQKHQNLFIFKIFAVLDHNHTGLSSTVWEGGGGLKGENLSV